MPKLPRHWPFAALVTALFAGAAFAADRADTSQQAADGLAHELFKELIEINTTDSAGSVTAAAEAVAKHFRAAGFPDADISVLGPDERKKNLVVRLHGAGKHRPVLLIGHLDVV